jgi:hypothetical protein
VDSYSRKVTQVVQQLMLHVQRNLGPGLNRQVRSYVWAKGRYQGWPRPV